jgi:DNA polymerase-2
MNKPPLVPVLDKVQQGFLLTREVVDSRHGILLIFWVKSHQGIFKLEIAGQQAVFFISSTSLDLAKDIAALHHLPLGFRPLTLTNFGDEPVCGCYFDQLKDFYQARELFKASGIKCYEDDIRPDERYLMERFITAAVDFTGNFEQQAGYIRATNARCKSSDFNLYKAIKLTTLSIDIECSASSQLYSIGCYSPPDDLAIRKVFMIGTDDNAGVQYIHYVKDERQLLEQFLAYIKHINPDILLGWNVVGFDLAVLEQRCQHHSMLLNLGRDGTKTYWRKSRNSEQQFARIGGRVVLDGIDLLKTATYSFASFSLDYVANSLLGTGKAIDDVDNRLQEITYKFHHDKLALAKYNLQDCQLVSDIFAHTQLVDFAKLRASLTGLEMDRNGGSVAAFTNLYLPRLHRSGFIAPNLGDGMKGLVSPGGYVMDSQPGLYEHVLVLDFKSLYPSIITTFKVDPVGMVQGLKAPAEAIPGFDGAFFSREQHFLPQIINRLWQQRDLAKADHNAPLSQAIKIIMNSFYGVLGSTGCRFFDPRLSGSITKRSHQILTTSKDWVEAMGYKVIYGDTDSIFVHIAEAASSQQADRIGKQLMNSLNKRWQRYIKETFALESFLEIEYETHYHKFFMPTIRGLDVGPKKRYAGLIDKLGEQQLVFKGLESVRTDWTQLAKDFQRSLYWKVFKGEPVEEFILHTVAKTKAGEYDDALIYRKRLRRKLSDYVKNIPPHVKAARHADQLNACQQKPLKYQQRGWIEYYITLNGPQTKEHKDSPLDYEFYIDRQLKSVADAILPFIGLSFEQVCDKQLPLF